MKKLIVDVLLYKIHLNFLTIFRQQFHSSDSISCCHPSEVHKFYKFFALSRLWELK